MGSSPSFPVVSLPRNKIVVITGANTGIGYEAAKNIAMMGATVIVACRSEERALDAIKRMNEEYLKDKAEGKLNENHIQEDRLPVEFMKLDLASLKSTMEFIEAYKASGRKLHVLLCNAGVAVFNREHTEDGYEKHFQINYLGHFLLVAHLLPIMKTSGDDCRVIFTSSRAYTYATFDLETCQANDPKDYGSLHFYAKSKLYQAQHMFSLTRRLTVSNVTVTTVFPGPVKTEIAREYYERRLYSFLLSIMVGLRYTLTPLQGAITLIDAAVNPLKKGLNGACLYYCESVSVASSASDEKYQEDLWKYSIDCLKEYLPDVILTELEGAARETYT